MKKVVYLDLEQILAIHFDQIERYGGSHGMRDLSLLESALARPQTSFMGEDLYPTIFDKTAALIHSLILNQPFLDGNKRTGVSAAAAFLYLNGLNLNCTLEELENLPVMIAEKKINLEEISVWLQDKSNIFQPLHR